MAVDFRGKQAPAQRLRLIIAVLPQQRTPLLLCQIAIGLVYTQYSLVIDDTALVHAPLDMLGYTMSRG